MSDDFRRDFNKRARLSGDNPLEPALEGTREAPSRGPAFSLVALISMFAIFAPYLMNRVLVIREGEVGVCYEGRDRHDAVRLRYLPGPGSIWCWNNSAAYPEESLSEEWRGAATPSGSSRFWTWDSSNPQDQFRGLPIEKSWELVEW